MSKENYRQAILTKQGRKALENKGGTIGYTDAEVRDKGRSRVLRRTGAAALLTTVALGASVYGIVKNDQVSANQVKADKAEAGKIFSNPGPGLTVTEGAPTASVPVAPEATAATSSDSEPAASTGETTTPAAASPEGAWTPTPGAVPVSSTEATPGGQASETGGLPAEPAPPEAGGVSPK
jgi:hypothetical protein